jgi:hypothetical protein
MGAEAQREGQEELRHHPLRLRRNENSQPKNAAASGEHPGFVRCLSGIGSKVVLARSGCSSQECVDGF